MNQILLTEKQDNKKKKNKSGSTDLRKIILFFAVVIILFGLIIAGVYGYKMYKNSNPEQKTAGNPQISLEDITGTEFTLKVESEIGIDKIIYYWDDEDPEEVALNGRTSNEEKMNVPEGAKKLKVEVIDLNGNSTKTEEDFTKYSTQEGPTIEINALDDEAKIQIKATDQAGMKYISYRWNEEEETTVQVANEGDITIETTIDVIRGTNRLTVRAVNSQDIETSDNQLFIGQNKPIINVEPVGDELHIKVSHDMGFERVEFYVNGQIYKYNQDYSGYDPTAKELEFKFKLQEGENTLIVLAVSTEQSEEIYQGKCMYPY